MDKIEKVDSRCSEADIPTDLLASLLMERSSAQRTIARQSDRLTPKIFAVMVLTSLSTFATLASAYQLLFAHQSFV